MWKKITFNTTVPQLKLIILQNFRNVELCNLAQIIENGNESFIIRLRSLLEKGEKRSNDTYNKLRDDCLKFLIGQPLLRVEVSIPTIEDAELIEDLKHKDITIDKDVKEILEEPKN
jgi:hypothetical protein